MKMIARVVKLEAGEEYTDGIERAEIKLRDAALSTYADKLFIRNTDNWRLGQDVSIVIEAQERTKEVAA